MWRIVSGDGISPRGGNVDNPLIRWLEDRICRLEPIALGAQIKELQMLRALLDRVQELERELDAERERADQNYEAYTQRVDLWSKERERLEREVALYKERVDTLLKQNQENFDGWAAEKARVFELEREVAELKGEK